MKAMGAAILAALVASLAVAQSPGLYLHVLEVRTEPSLELKHRPLEIVLEASSRSEKWKHGLSELTEVRVGAEDAEPEGAACAELVLVLLEPAEDLVERGHAQSLDRNRDRPSRRPGAL